jgi:hypothetical protein
MRWALIRRGLDPHDRRRLQAASAQGRLALGRHAGLRPATLGVVPPPDGGQRPPQARSRPRLCAEADGYNLHAAVSVKDVRRDRLEHLCRYLGRPPVANDRLSLLDDEREGPPPDEDAFDADADADDPKDWEQEGFDWAA